MLDIYFLKPDNIDEVAKDTRLTIPYLEGLLANNDNKTVTLTVDTKDSSGRIDRDS